MKSENKNISRSFNNYPGHTAEMFMQISGFKKLSPELNIHLSGYLIHFSQQFSENTKVNKNTDHIIRKAADIDIKTSAAYILTELFDRRIDNMFGETIKYVLQAALYIRHLNFIYRILTGTFRRTFLLYGSFPAFPGGMLKFYGSSSDFYRISSDKSGQSPELFCEIPERYRGMSGRCGSFPAFYRSSPEESGETFFISGSFSELLKSFSDIYRSSPDLSREVSNICGSCPV